MQYNNQLLAQSMIPQGWKRKEIVQPLNGNLLGEPQPKTILASQEVNDDLDEPLDANEEATKTASLLTLTLNTNPNSKRPSLPALTMKSIISPLSARPLTSVTLQPPANEKNPGWFASKKDRTKK
jgi:hypothetical protein